MSEISTWRGLRREDFEWNGKACILVRPDAPRPDRPWIWRAEFFDAFAQVDEAMAQRGYYMAYCGLSDRYGCPSAVEDMEAFRQMLVAREGLSPRPILFGFSRGGLYACNYALKYPDHVDKLYLDAPVTDIRSWPGGYGALPGDQALWAECMACYGLTEETARAYDGGPLAHAEDLARTGIPVALVAGDSDAVVRWEENGLPFSQRFRAAGGEILVILKPGCDHHPHSLDDPTPVVEFLDRARQAAEDRR